MTGTLLQLATLGAAALSVGVILFTYRAEKLAGAITVILLTAMVLAPMHLVPQAVRFAELGALLLLPLVILMRRGLALGGPLPLFLIGYLIVTYCSTQASSNEGAGRQLLMHATVGLAFLVCGATLNEGERAGVQTAAVVLASGQALYAVYEFASQPPVLWASAVPGASERKRHEILTGAYRAQGTFGHPLLLSMFLVVALAIVMRRPLRNQGMYAATVALLLGGVFCSGSRSALIVAVAMVLFVFGSRNYSVTRGVVLSGVVGFLVALSPIGSDAYKRFTGSGSLSHRLGAIEIIPNLLVQPPFELWFGHGWYSTKTLFRRGLLQNDGLMAIDNQWVATLATSGLIGVAFWLALMVVSLRAAPLQLRLPLTAAFLPFLVFDVLEFPSTWSLLALFLGMAATRREALTLPPVGFDSSAGFGR
ncbi:O-antigen ligase family protein [Streptomyces sp. NBC_01615]|uniref:O-antigen ligase family protein n=1 Tax=Streptomyces sp. NBC_01615 TaxID=2975898 RepID=UPI00386E584A